MAQSVKTMLEAANAAVERISPVDAKAMLDRGEALVIDVREPPELAASGKVPGALAIPRGLIEFKADAEAPTHDPKLRKDATIILYCASGGRSALAGHTLKQFGYGKVLNMGGFKGWVEAGLPVEPVKD